jgi:hypothetical protein
MQELLDDPQADVDMDGPLGKILVLDSDNEQNRPAAKKRKAASSGKAKKVKARRSGKVTPPADQGAQNDMGEQHSTSLVYI